MIQLETTRGSDVSITVAVEDTLADPVQPLDLTGATYEVFEASAGIAGRITAAQAADPTQGAFLIRVEGTEPLLATRHTWRVRIDLPGGGDSIGLPLFVLEVR